MANHFEQILSNSTLKLTEELLNTFNHYKKSESIDQSPELNLIRSIKPFLQSRQVGQIDSVTEAMTNMMAIRHIIDERQMKGAGDKSMGAMQVPRSNNKVVEKMSLFEDENSIYELDNGCLVDNMEIQKEGHGLVQKDDNMFMLMLLLLFMN